MSTSDPVVAAGLRGLVDDASIFPPGNASLDEAVRAHLGHRSAPYADLVGPFVVGDDRLPALAETLAREAPGASLRVSVVVSGGAGAIESAVRWAVRPGSLTLAAVEVALRDSATGELRHNAARIVTAVDQLVSTGDLDDEVPVYVEMPRLYGAPPSPDWLAALDEMAAVEHRLKLRTGGPTADDVPPASELATCIGAALDRELAFKCTAGLHHAVRHRDVETGVQQHGFLNVLAATRASLDGATVPEVSALLDETDPATLMSGTDDAGLAGARRWFRSFGSCSVVEPLADLEALGLLGERPDP